MAFGVHLLDAKCRQEGRSHGQRKRLVSRQSKQSGTKRRRRVLFATASLGLGLGGALAIAEIALRLAADASEFLPYHRNSTRNFYPTDEITPGITGTSKFTSNSFGARGPELKGERIRILTIGGSTTACTVLDDTESWPQLLMDHLNADAGDDKFCWVTNSGVDGHNSDHHLLHVKHFLPSLPSIDYVLIYRRPERPRNLALSNRLR